MILLLMIITLLSCCGAIPFRHDIDFQHPESGEHVKLQSDGELRDTVDLDRIDGIKRVVCEKSKVLIAAQTNGIAKEWIAGQIILGSAKWDCHRNTLGSNTRGIYAKILSVYFPTETGIVVHTEKAGAFDVIDQASIKFHYHPGNETNHPPEVRRRHRRYLANILSELLRNIDWKANFSTEVPWNYDLTSKSSGPFFKVATAANNSDYDVLFGDQNVTDEEVFSFNCHDCYGRSTFSYTFEMVIKKNAVNEPEIHHYLSKLETNTSMVFDTSLNVNDAMKVELTKTILQHPPKTLLNIPVAVVEDARIPPVMLTVNLESNTHIEINMTASASVKSEHRHNITGFYEIVQEYSGRHGMEGYVKADNWKVNTDKAFTDTQKDLYLTTAVFQNINVTTTIGWLARDMEINFSPPVEFRINPTITSVSSTNDVKRCTVNSLRIEGKFNVSDARLLVDAFDIPIWNTLLAEGFNRTVKITEGVVNTSCSADCFPRTLQHADAKAEYVVGKMKQRILRNDTSFLKLQQMFGNSVLFASEEAESAQWCGYPGRKCVRCTNNVAGDDDVLKCADRMMTSTLASSTSLLGKYVTAEWPQRKLIVHEAWDEATSVNPNGEHGNVSLHYEGRAAILSVSSDLSNSSSILDSDPTLFGRLENLAVCAGFPYVSQEPDRHLVHVAVKDENSTHMKRKSNRITDSKDRAAFANALKKIGSLVSPASCPDIRLNRTKHWPDMYRNEKEACGDTTYVIHREKENEMQHLYEYADMDVQFADEGPKGKECGPGRECKTCTRPSVSDSTWDWCGTRTMSPRMALRLKRLAVLVNKDPVLKGGMVRVLKAFSDIADGTFVSSLHKTGRALRFDYFNNGIPASKGQMDRLASLSVCAGFDFVDYKTNHIAAFVKEQSGFRTTLNSYPSGEVLISVEPPLDKPEEFSFPVNLQHESRKPALLRALDDRAKLSKHFRLVDFKDKSTPYLRIDSTLIECLDMTKDSLHQRLDILKAYTTKSTNKEMNSEWNQGQLDRFQMGQAVVIQQEDQSADSTLELAKLLMSTCTGMLRLQKRGLSLSIKDSGTCIKESQLSSNAKYCIYVGIYPIERSPQRQFVKLDVKISNGGGDNNNKWDDLKEYRSELIAGGPQIIPYNVEEACKPPELGEENAHLSFKLNHIGFCLNFKSKKQCEKSTEARRQEIDRLWKQISPRLSTESGLKVKNAMMGCLFKTCGGCPGAGSKWDKKVKACVDFIDKYMQTTGKGLVSKTDKVAFFNTENEKSAAHGLACRDGVRCVENAQLYSMLHTTVMSKYKPEPNNSIEEALFDGHDNASPVLEILEQQLAYQTNGNVTVYIENIRDISALRNVLKVLMVYNKKVDLVSFMTFKGVKRDKLASAIQRKLETWAGSACPKWSRFAVVPYKIDEVPPSRAARSIEDGRHRNKMKEVQRNWEIDWLMKT